VGEYTDQPYCRGPYMPSNEWLHLKVVLAFNNILTPDHRQSDRSYSV